MAQLAPPAPPPLAQLIATFQAAFPAIQALLPAFQAAQSQDLADGIQDIVAACRAVVYAFQNIISGTQTIQQELVKLRYEAERSLARGDNVHAGLNGDFTSIGAAPGHVPLAPGNFPSNMRELLELTEPRADALIASWGLVVQLPENIANKRIAVARYIGVRIPN